MPFSVFDMTRVWKVKPDRDALADAPAFRKVYRRGGRGSVCKRERAMAKMREELRDLKDEAGLPRRAAARSPPQAAGITSSTSTTVRSVINRPVFLCTILMVA